MSENSGKKSLLVDTSVLIDTFKFQGRFDYFKEIASTFQWTFTTDIALLEFKAVVIQEMITIHADLVRTKSFTKTKFRSIEKKHRQVSLRSHIFDNFINVTTGSSYTLTPMQDEVLAEEARILLEAHIRKVYRDFSKRVGSVQKELVGCDRAIEPPKKMRLTYNPNIPTCKRGINKTCNVENVFRSNIAPRLTEIRNVAAESNQLARACDKTQEVIDSGDIDLKASDCRCAGDCLIVFGGSEIATHSISSNGREWKPLSDLVQIEFIPTEYPDRKKM